MKEPHKQGLANQFGRESSAGSREATGEALTAEYPGRPLSSTLFRFLSTQVAPFYTLTLALFLTLIISRILVPFLEFEAVAADYTRHRARNAHRSTPTRSASEGRTMTYTPRGHV
jgi:hypothetical protein